jgi:DNA-binding transcriptional ArsR family regulator
MLDPKPEPAPFKPDAEFIVNDLETLKVLADPLRLQIIELMTPSPRTVKQIAADLRLPPTKLYYHIKQLEERSLIRVTDTRIVSGILEKQYQAAASSYRVNKELFSLTSHAGKEGLNVMLTGLFEDIREDIQQSVEAGVINVSAPEDEEKPLSSSLLISRNNLSLSPDQADEFYRRLRALVREYARDDNASVIEGQPDEISFCLMIALYPSIRLTQDVSEPKL